MHIFFRSNVVMLLASTVIGCASTSEPIEPREFQSNYSYAYNLANQTVLTRNSSKLRDFTKEEAEEIKNAPINTGGNTNILFGAASILTGNLTGVISVAGGVAANVADDHNHPSSSPRWLIRLKKTEHSSKEDAVKYAQNMIQSASMRYFNSIGVATYTLSENGYKYGSLDGIDIGLYYEESYAITSISENNDEYLIGYLSGRWSLFNMTPIHHFYNDNTEKQPIDYPDMLSKITGELPNNFMLYVPPFGKEYTKKGHYRDYSHRIPAIYQSGVKHEFIKPE